MNAITYIPVVDAEEKPLAPCSPGKARQLLKSGRAKPYSRWDIFAIQLLDRVVPEEKIGQSTLGVDPGADHTGLAVFQQKANGARQGLLAVTIHHRGNQVKKGIEQRSNYRRSRRFRLRNRPARFDHRPKPKDWLAPSLQTRLGNTTTWIPRLQKLIAINQILVETMKFDTQKLQNLDIQGKEYQQGILQNTEKRAYVHDRDQNKCRYCGKPETKDNRLTLDHVIPRSNTTSSDRVSNLVAACYPCNQAKGNMPIENFLADQPELLAEIKTQLQKPLTSAGQSNTIMSQLRKHLHQLSCKVTETDAAHTAANRIITGIPKTHSNDALVLGELTQLTNLPPAIEFQAKGHGRRQRCMPNKFGTPKGKAWPKYCRARDKGRDLPSLPPSHKQRQLRFPDPNGISTGDYVRANNRNGTFTGYAMIHIQGKGVVLSGGHKPAITARIRNTRLLRRNHGYYRLNTTK